MKLLKFNLVFIPFLALCLGLVGYIARKMLLDDAQQHVIQNARIIMETMLSSRTYTTKQVAPLLQQKNFKLQTAIEEFRKTIDEMPKNFGSECRERHSWKQKRRFYSRPAACAPSSTTVPGICERQAGRTDSIPSFIRSRFPHSPRRKSSVIFARNFPTIFTRKPRLTRLIRAIARQTGRATW